MSITFMNSENIYYAFRSGAHAVIKQKKELNNINVFPVPDGDTGTNLACLMQAILEEAKMRDSAKETMYSIAEAALNGARGNSGIIFAQFINGIYMALNEKRQISIADFSIAAKNAVAYAYQSITNPVEGTILTVMRDWSESLYILKDKTSDFAQLFNRSLEDALQSLIRTPDKLKVLKDASVVDSGAKGFVHFLEGATYYLTTLNISETAESELSADEEYETDVHQLENVDLTHRYCTEALIKGKDISLQQIKQSLQHLGDSLIVAGGSTKVRVHIHTNSPADIIHRLREFGQIIQQKADDMARQYDAVHARKHKIALVTDSIADLPRELMDQYQIHMIPLNIIIEESSYLDKITISPTYLYERMDDHGNYPTSSQPSQKAAEDFLKYLKSHYEKIIVITVSKQMSGTFDTIVKASQNIGLNEKEIAIIDSKLNSGAQGLVVLKAAEDIAAGKEFPEIIKSIQHTIENTTIFVSIQTLKYMVRSGRVKKIQGIAAKLVNLKPVVSIDTQGTGTITGKALSLKGNTKKIQSLVSEILETNKVVKYSIVHADATIRAQHFEQIFTSLIGKKPEYTTDISSIVAMNAGVGSVGIALTTE
jgi:uncharacterized protein